MMTKTILHQIIYTEFRKRGKTEEESTKALQEVVGGISQETLQNAQKLKQELTTISIVLDRVANSIN